MASPAVAGVAAIIRSFYPKLSAAQVKQVIMDSGLTTNADVIVGGDRNNTQDFKELSTSGKMVNLYNALILASQTKYNSSKLPLCKPRGIISKKNILISRRCFGNKHLNLDY